METVLLSLNMEVVVVYRICSVKSMVFVKKDLEEITSFWRLLFFSVFSDSFFSSAFSFIIIWHLPLQCNFGLALLIQSFA